MGVLADFVNSKGGNAPIGSSITSPSGLGVSSTGKMGTLATFVASIPKNKPITPTPVTTPKKIVTSPLDNVINTVKKTIGNITVSLTKPKLSTTAATALKSITPGPIQIKPGQTKIDPKVLQQKLSGFDSGGVSGQSAMVTPQVQATAQKTSAPIIDAVTKFNPIDSAITAGQNALAKQAQNSIEGKTQGPQLVHTLAFYQKLTEPLLKDKIARKIVSAQGQMYLGSSKKFEDTFNTPLDKPVTIGEKVAFTAIDIGVGFANMVYGGKLLGALGVAKAKIMPLLLTTYGQLSASSKTTINERLASMPIDYLTGWLFNLVPESKKLFSLQTLKGMGYVGGITAPTAFVSYLVKGLPPKDAAEAALKSTAINVLLHTALVAKSRSEKTLFGEQRVYGEKVMTPEEAKTQTIKPNPEVILKAETEGKNIKASAVVVKEGVLPKKNWVSADTLRKLGIDVPSINGKNEGFRIDYKLVDKPTVDLLPSGEHTPSEVIGQIQKTGLDKTPEGREIIKTALQAQEQGQNITIENKTSPTKNENIKTVKPELVTNGFTTIKPEQINTQTPKIKALEQAIKDGVIIPPVPVYEEQGKYITNNDGFHRSQAYKNLGMDVPIRIESKTTLSGTEKQKLENQPNESVATQEQRAKAAADQKLNNELKPQFQIGDKVLDKNGKSYIVKSSYVENGKMRYDVYTPGKKASPANQFRVWESSLKSTTSLPSPTKGVAPSEAQKGVQGSDRGGVKIVTDPSQVQEIKNSIAEGEGYLSTKKGADGNKLTEEEVKNIKDTVNKRMEEIKAAKEAQDKKPPVEQSPKNIPSNTDAQTPIGTGDKAKSKAYTRIYDRLAEEVRQDVNYNKLNLDKDTENALNFITQDPERALRVGLGLEQPPTGQSETAISIALADKAGRDGDSSLQSQLEASRSLRQTRRGQEIVSERGRFDETSPHTYIRELMDRRLNNLGSNLKGALKNAAGKVQSAKEAAMHKIDAEVSKIKKKIYADRKKIQLAQDIIDSIIC